MNLIWLFVLGGVLVAAIGWQLRRRTLQFLAKAQRAIATGETSATHTSVLSGGSSDYSTLSFVASNGRRYQVESRLGLPGGAYRPGSQIPVVYDPDDPQHAVVDRFIELHLPWLIFAILGGGWIIFGAIAVLVLH